MDEKRKCSRGWWIFSDPFFQCSLLFVREPFYSQALTSFGSIPFFFQINIDKFNVGRFTSHTNDGCPDGYMTISEQNFSLLDTTSDVFNNGNGEGRTSPNGDGKWCGNAWGYNVYYSESSSINITLALFKFAQQPQLSLTPNNNNFSFRLTYKFLKRTDAKLR